MTRRPDALRTAPDPGSLKQEVGRLDGLDLAQLRVQYRNRTGRIAPARLSRALLLRVLAYRMQADTLRDLRPDTRRLIDRLGTELAGPQQDGKRLAVPAVGVSRPKRGTILAREWQGRMEHVTVLDDGFLWGSDSFGSLSAVASAITGTKWNGRRFFGLDRPTSPDKQRAAS